MSDFSSDARGWACCMKTCPAGVCVYCLVPFIGNLCKRQIFRDRKERSVGVWGGDEEQLGQLPADRRLPVRTMEMS